MSTQGFRYLYQKDLESWNVEKEAVQQGGLLVLPVVLPVVEEQVDGVGAVVLP